ncbi:MAG: hypothetical protein WBX25_03965 [Rhodomicrobium sp.]
MREVFWRLACVKREKLQALDRAIDALARERACLIDPLATLKVPWAERLPEPVRIA